MMVNCSRCGNAFDEIYGVCPLCGTPYISPMMPNEQPVNNVPPVMSNAQVVSNTPPLQPNGQQPDTAFVSPEAFAFRQEKTAGKKKKWGKRLAIIAVIAVVMIGMVLALVLILSHQAVSTEAREQLSLGEKYMRDEDFDEAIVAFHKAIDIDPNNTEAYLKLSDAYHAVGNFSEAIRILQLGFERTRSGEIKAKLDELAAQTTLEALTNGQPVKETGACGDNLTYTLYENGVTVIAGEGRLPDTDKNNVPWHNKKIGELFIQEGVSEIGQYAFRDCDTITTIHLPRSVVRIGEWAFNDCDRLTGIEVDPDNNYYSSMDGILYNKERTVLEHYPSGKWGVYVVPMTVTQIQNWAFAGSRYLRYIGVEGGNEAFLGIDGVLFDKEGHTLLCFPQAKTGQDGVYTVPDGVTVIGAHAFYECEALTSVTLPSGVEQVDFHAFERFTAEQTIYIEGKTSVPDGWDSRWNYKCRAEIVWQPPQESTSSEAYESYSPYF